MGEVKAGKRRYDSALRRQQASQTRMRILDAAQRLFADRGYPAATVEAIASEAGVATDTVYAAFGTKPGVLRELLNVRVVGDDSPQPLLDRPGPQAVRAQSTQRRQIAAFARDIVVILERARPVDDIIRSAAAVDPEVARLRDQMQQGRHDNLSRFVGWLAEKRTLRHGMSREHAAAIVWTLASPEVHRLLRAERAWSVDRYSAWLEDTLARTLLS
jgi:AcrR family transcriptional regulator